MFHNLSNDTLYMAVKLTASFMVPTVEKPYGKCGTGFFVYDSNRELWLVTNRHILEADYGKAGAEFRSAQLTDLKIATFVWPITKQLQRAHRVIPTPVTLTVDPVLLQNLLFPANRDEDVACLRCGTLRTQSGDSALLGNVWSLSVLADDDWIEDNLEVCDFVAFPGYPPWHDKLDGRPILRTGTIASDPRTNYSNLPTSLGRRVAYEAFSFDGSSGSPVIAVLKTDPSLPADGRRPKVIGINAGRLLAEYSTHSGISYFIKSSAILELLR